MAETKRKRQKNLKTEKKILSGHYIGLSPKCYVMEDDNSDRKLSHKGVPKHVNLTVDHYMRCLYQNDRGRVSYSNITINHTIFPIVHQ